MLARRSAMALLRQARPQAPLAFRSFSVAPMRKEAPKNNEAPGDLTQLKSLHEIKKDEDLLPPGAPIGTMPTDLNQSTGLERLEILGKVQGIDVFDMRPLDTSRKGTIENPVSVDSFGEEQYVGCSGVPSDTHEIAWMVISRDRPIERCVHCGNTVKMNYTGPDDPHHGHAPEVFEPKTFADYIKPEYTYR